jgi:hypothetical protein
MGIVVESLELCHEIIGVAGFENPCAFGDVLGEENSIGSHTGNAPAAGAGFANTPIEPIGASIPAALQAPHFGSGYLIDFGLATAAVINPTRLRTRKISYQNGSSIERGTDFGTDADECECISRTGGSALEYRDVHCLHNNSAGVLQTDEYGQQQYRLSGHHQHTWDTPAPEALLLIKLSGLGSNEKAFLIKGSS